jgi:hypothetical protein
MHLFTQVAVARGEVANGGDTWPVQGLLGLSAAAGQLVTAPVHFIDDVIKHELCPWKVGNHGPSVYRLLGQPLPDWEARKSRMGRFAAS